MIMKNVIIFTLAGMFLFIPVLYVLFFQFYYLGEWFSLRAENPEASIPLNVVLISLGIYAYVSLIYGSLLLGLLNKVINGEWSIINSVRRAVVSFVVGFVPFFVFLLFSTSATFHIVYRVGWEVKGPATGEDVGAGFVFGLISFLLFSLFLLPIFLYQLNSIVYETEIVYGDISDEDFEEY